MWNFVADDVDRFQSDYDFVDDWTADAAEQTKIVIDGDVLGDIYADADPANSGATAGAKSGSINLGATGAFLTLDKTNILDLIVDVGTVLDEQNVPDSDRWIILPPRACGHIKKSDLQDASLAGDGTSILRNGRLGMIDRFTIYRSNQLATTVDGTDTITNIIAGHMSSLTFASQFTENQSLVAESTFGTLFRGLQVYGYNVNKPEGLAHVYAKV